MNVAVVKILKYCYLLVFALSSIGCSTSKSTGIVSSREAPSVGFRNKREIDEQKVFHCHVRTSTVANGDYEALMHIIIKVYHQLSSKVYH